MAKFNDTPPDLSLPSGRLRWAREEAGYRSAREAARARGWSENTYRSHEDGNRVKRGFKPEDAEKYARAFKVSEHWLMTGKGGAIPAPQVEALSPEEAELIRLMREAKRSA